MKRSRGARPALARRHVVRWRMASTSALAASAALGACADFATAVDPTFGLPDVAVASPTLVRDIQPILDKRCAFGGCHSAATRQAGLSLVSTESFDALVGHRATLRPSQTLVVAGDTTRSWLLVMLGSDDARRGGFSRMPLAATPLTPKQLATFARWIASGAPRQ